MPNKNSPSMWKNAENNQKKWVFFLLQQVQTWIKAACWYLHNPPAFAHCAWCLVTWKEGSRLFPCGALTSLFVVPGEPALVSTQLYRDRSLLWLWGKSPRLFCVNPLRSCSAIVLRQPRPSPALPREAGPHYSRLHVKKVKLTQQRRGVCSPFYNAKQFRFICLPLQQLILMADWLRDRQVEVKLADCPESHFKLVSYKLMREKSFF